MEVLVTGNLGYIGPVLGPYLKSNLNLDCLLGVDTGHFIFDVSSRYGRGDAKYDKQLFKDVRDIIDHDLFNTDAVIALAAVSNDPMGKAFSDATFDINHKSVITLATKAKAAGVRKFIFASSCSVYGEGGDLAKTEEDSVQPLTDYAQSKIMSEMALASLASDTFSVVCLRFATACGVSDRTRLDLVLNDFVWEYTVSGKIKILSDGSPLRPLIDVADMSRALCWAVDFEPKENFLVLNCGYNEANFSVMEIAKKVSNGITKIIEVNPEAVPDKRSYRVDFSKFQNLSGFATPLISIDQSVDMLKKHFRMLIDEYDGKQVNKDLFVRHYTLKKLIADGRLASNLRWKR
jgi:nucleoside-diphosphate-sugar epimerase